MPSTQSTMYAYEYTTTNDFEDGKAAFAEVNATSDSGSDATSDTSEATAAKWLEESPCGWINEWESLSWTEEWESLSYDRSRESSPEVQEKIVHTDDHSCSKTQLSLQTLVDFYDQTPTSNFWNNFDASSQEFQKIEKIWENNDVNQEQECDIEVLDLVEITCKPLDIVGVFGRVTKIQGTKCRVAFHFPRECRVYNLLFDVQYLQKMDFTQKAHKITFSEYVPEMEFTPNNIEEMEATGERDWRGARILINHDPFLVEKIPAGFVVSKINNEDCTNWRFNKIAKELDMVKLPYELEFTPMK